MFAVALGRPAPARAGAFDYADTTWEGCSELLDLAREVLGPDRVVLRYSLAWDQLAPADGLLLLHPMRTVDSDEASAFMRAGGRVALLDDHGRGEPLLSRFQIRRAPPPTKPIESLRGKAALAIAEPAVEPDSGPHPLAAESPRLVTNHPTTLLHPNLSPVFRIRSLGQPDAILAVAGQVGKGRLVAMGDPSAVMNQMLRYPGNRKFAEALVRYLTDDPAVGRKGGRLYLLANELEQTGSYGGDETLLDSLASRLRSLAEWASDVRRDGFPGWTWLALAVGTALGIAAWVLRAAGRPYLSPPPRYSRGAALAGQGGVVGRFAVLAAPSAPRAFLLLELKSALVDAARAKWHLEHDPPLDRVLDLVRASGLDATALAGFVHTVRAVEGSVVRGRPKRLSRRALHEAAALVRGTIQALGLPTPPAVVDLPAAPSRPGSRHSPPNEVAGGAAPSAQPSELAPSPPMPPDRGDST